MGRWLAAVKVHAGSTRSMMTIEVTKHAVCLVSHPFDANGAD